VEKFADLLRENRQRARLTQKDLAERVGVDHSYISKIERGIYAPPARDKVLAIVDVLGITNRAVRAYFLLAASCASTDDLEGLYGESHAEDTGDNILPFAAAAFHFPQPDQLEEEAVLEKIRQLLRFAGLSREQRAECIELILSFLAWVEFRIGREIREPQGEQSTRMGAGSPAL